MLINPPTQLRKALEEIRENFFVVCWDGSIAYFSQDFPKFYKTGQIVYGPLRVEIREIDDLVKLWEEGYKEVMNVRKFPEKTMSSILCLLGASSENEIRFPEQDK